MRFLTLDFLLHFLRGNSFSYHFAKSISITCSFFSIGVGVTQCWWALSIHYIFMDLQSTEWLEIQYPLGKHWLLLKSFGKSPGLIFHSRSTGCARPKKNRSATFERLRELSPWDFLTLYLLLDFLRSIWFWNLVAKIMSISFPFFSIRGGVTWRQRAFSIH